MEISTALDTKAVAARLRISRRTVTRMAEDGRLNPVKVPGYRGAYLFDPQDIDALAPSEGGDE